MKIYLSKESELQAQIADLKQKLKERDEDVKYWIDNLADGCAEACCQCGRLRNESDMRVSRYDCDIRCCSEDCLSQVDEDIERDAEEWEDTARAMRINRILDVTTK